MITIRLIDKTADLEICKALPALAGIVQTQVMGEFKQMWQCDDVLVGCGNEAADDEWPCFIVPKLDDPDALAYHDEEATGYPGLYVGRDVILNNGGTILKGSNSICAAFSHEVLEALVDPFCDFYAQWTDDRMVGLEVCDPCQDGHYDVSDGQNIGTVSNFVYREWFRDGPTRSKYDYLGQLQRPRTIAPGGYVAFSNGDQIFGHAMPGWKRVQKTRSSRRIRKIARARMKELAIRP